jgi:molecular chaperone GrpE
MIVGVRRDRPDRRRARVGVIGPTRLNYARVISDGPIQTRTSLHRARGRRRGGRIARQETDNVRKRAEREVAEARAYGIANFARDTIGVADNLARALEAIAPESRANADDTLKALLDGVDLTRRDLRNTLKKHGVRELDPKGEKFDPNFHQAMYEVPDPEVAAGTVVQVMQTGYAIGDRVLRPALVAVAKGGAKNNGKSDTPEPATPRAPGRGEA